MPVELFSNNASTTLNGLVDSVVTSLVVTSAALFPVAVTGVSQFRIIIESEILIVTNTAGLTWTVTRGAEGTTAAGHATGIAVVQIISGGGVTSLDGYLGQRYRLEVGRTTNDTTSFQTISTAFTTVDVGGVSTASPRTSLADPSASFNATTSIYTVPVTGLYQCSGSLRLNDATAASVNYGLGIHTSNADGPWFLWSSFASNATGPRRATGAYLRVASFNAGDQLRLYAYVDATAQGVRAASLIVVPIGGS